MGSEGALLAAHSLWVTFVLVTAVAPTPAAERAVAERNGAEGRWGPASSHRGNPQQGLGALEL